MLFAKIGQVYLLWGFIFSQKFCFWAIILAPETLENRSNPLTTRFIA